MGPALRFRRILKQALVQPRVNTVVRTVLSNRVITRAIPQHQLVRIPVIGRVPVDLPNGRRFWMQTDGDDAIASLLFWRRRLLAYEPDTTRLFLGLLESARTFFDIGANTGIFTLAAAAQDPSRQVYAFEPFPAIHDYLARNVALNSLENVRLFSIALSDFAGSTPFYIPSASAVFPLSASTAAGLSPQVEEIQVPVTTLDQFVDEHSVERVDLMKIDTETTEHQVLAGAAKTLGRFRPIVICEVLPVGKEPLLHAILDDLDYAYFWIRGGQLVRTAVITGDATRAHLNYLFVPAERVHEIDTASVSADPP
jgi:FkbM family methyltransferase